MILSKGQIGRLYDDMWYAAEHGDTPEWRAWHEQTTKQMVYLVIPLGEIFNPFVAIFARYNPMPKPQAIDSRYGFAAQGIEGMVRIPMSLLDALFLYRQLPAYRRAIEQES